MLTPRSAARGQGGRYGRKASTPATAGCCCAARQGRSHGNRLGDVVQRDGCAADRLGKRCSIVATPYRVGPGAAAGTEATVPAGFRPDHADRVGETGHTADPDSSRQEAAAGGIGRCVVSEACTCGAMNSATGRCPATGQKGSLSARPTVPESLQQVLDRMPMSPAIVKTPT